MSIPYIDESRQDYIDRQKGNQLYFAVKQHHFGSDRGMWLHLLTWAQCDDIYGEHWDRVNAYIEGKK
jgi:hypothetical protein